MSQQTTFTWPLTQKRQDRLGRRVRAEKLLQARRLALFPECPFCGNTDAKEVIEPLSYDDRALDEPSYACHACGMHFV